MKVNSKIMLALVIVALLSGCGGSSKKNDPIPTIAAPKLLSPANNQLCTTGQSLTDATSIVSFSWGEVNNAVSYTFYVTNLLSGQVTSKKVNGAGTTDTLLKATPYSWIVVAHGSSGDSPSDTWRFYVFGPAAINYAPFPADLTAPAQGAELSSRAPVSLTWVGSSVQNNITGYDIYFGTSVNPPLYKSDITGTVLGNISVSPNTTYYWKVVTKDSNGDSSDSELFQFSSF